MKSWKTIKHGGWHLSYFGTAEFIKNKIENFSHQEYNTPNFTEIGSIDNKIQSRQDIYDRNIKLLKNESSYLPPGFDRKPLFFYP
jgi:hypothetical protein